ncbi:hypothetical protein VN12_14915 [Pirellula sp. SH-Sr6A]|uniref:PEP-CTERM sorting domain-containing protein n=1 Tax=Pirellula sp. SH-Sr6A TaxID=1632865 RepID=UPI00078E2C4A|nr:PEP-CTERM sorting domain-containing protein [Pirellula sp. SH-Sr6A]AMV33415.1 hypothetical protein VN12_14915 [Pirellula sp. SH-Sr6A]
MKAAFAFRWMAAWALVHFLLTPQLRAGITVSDLNSTYTQDFNTLVSTGTTAVAWSNNLTLPGWSLFNSTNAAVPTYLPGTGSTTTGSFYSFGATGSSERALGSTGSGGTYFGSPATGSVAGYIAVQFENQTGSTIDSFTLGFAGEQWRNGGNATAQTMVFEYGFGAAFDTVAAWNAPGSNFDFTSPVATASAAAVDGNIGGRVEGLGGTIAGLNWSTGDSLWLRWIERNDAGNDHGLGVDDLSFSVSAVPEPSSMLLLGCFGMAGGAWGWRKRCVRKADAS